MVRRAVGPLGLFCARSDRKGIPCKGAIPVEKELMTTLLRKVLHK
jgi:hypothetical protein